MRGSEFGRGYATCLRQFVNHRNRLGERLALWADMRRRSPTDLFTEASAVESWANGASDHLYELIRPRKGVPRAEWKLAVGVQTRGLDIGHGFRPTSKATAAEAVGLLDIADELLAALAERGHAVGSLADAMETDRALGLNPDEGSWSCSEDLRRDKAGFQVTPHVPDPRTLRRLALRADGWIRNGNTADGTVDDFSLFRHATSPAAVLGLLDRAEAAEALLWRAMSVMDGATIAIDQSPTAKDHRPFEWAIRTLMYVHRLFGLDEAGLPKPDQTPEQRALAEAALQTVIREEADRAGRLAELRAALQESPDDR